MSVQFKIENSLKRLAGTRRVATLRVSLWDKDHDLLFTDQIAARVVRSPRYAGHQRVAAMVKHYGGLVSYALTEGLTSEGDFIDGDTINP